MYNACFKLKVSMHRLGNSTECPLGIKENKNHVAGMGKILGFSHYFKTADSDVPAFPIRPRS